MAWKLTITDPSGAYPLIEEHRHFSVEGTITHTEPLAEDAVVTVEVLDQGGTTLRFSRQERKDNRNLFTDCPLLTGYPKGMDDDWKHLKDYGFPPLLVRDLSDPQASLRDATIKCWYDDTSFKAIIVTATDVEHGLLLDDHMRFTDDKGRPYAALPKGGYTIRVTLSARDGTYLAMTEKPIRIGAYPDVAINRFNPPEHRKRMNAWCQARQIHVLNDLVPGYLNPYLGPWFYHMGLLPMYLASDVSQYVDSHVHLFVYLLDESSTSYSTELAFLETKGCIEDPKRLSVYHYDIGEAVIGKGTSHEQNGTIRRFPDGQFLWICRIDLTNFLAKENQYDLSGKSVVQAQTDKRHLVVPAGKPFAITGVVRPWQFDPGDFTLLESNAYRWRNKVASIRYRFASGKREWEETRTLGMQRIDGNPIGGSTLEFYNLFILPESEQGRMVTLTACALDTRGNSHAGARESITFQVV